MQVLFCVSVTISVMDWSNESFGCSSYIQGDYSQGGITKRQHPVSMLSYRRRLLPHPCLLVILIKNKCFLELFKSGISLQRVYTR